MNDDASRKSGGLRVVAVFKGVKALVLIVAGVGALGLLNAGIDRQAQDWLHQLSLNAGRRIVAVGATRANDLLGGATPARKLLIAGGSFAYAAVFLVEAVGLWLQKHWAEYLTFLVTASLLPFEVIAVMHEPSVVRVLTLVLNIAVLGYLAWRLVDRVREARSATGTHGVAPRVDAARR